MEDKISYAVFGKAKEDESFSMFAGWFENYNHVAKLFNECIENPRYKGAQIVERTEHFEIVEQKIKKHDSKEKQNENH